MAYKIPMTREALIRQIRATFEAQLAENFGTSEYDSVAYNVICDDALGTYNDAREDQLPHAEAKENANNDWATNTVEMLRGMFDRMADTTEDIVNDVAG